MELTTRKISTNEIKICTDFKNILKDVYEYNKDHDLDKLYNSIKDYNYDFLDEIKNHFKEFSDSKSHNESRIKLFQNKIEQNYKLIDRAISLYSQGKFDFELPEKLDLKSFSQKKEFISKDILSSFFSAGKVLGLVSKFNKDDVEDLMNLKLENKKTALNLKPEMSWQHIVFFMKNLTDKDEIKIGSNFNIWMRFNSSDDYKELENLIEQYQQSNDKKVIPRILEIINSNPIIKEKNDEYKSIKTLYRGIGSEEPLSNKDIEAQDKKSKYISTTPHKNVAKRFAKGIGHLESEDISRNEYQYIIEYSTSHDSILFSTELTGEMYNETDIIIDATKATIKNIDEL